MAVLRRQSRSSPPQHSWAVLGAAKYYCDDSPGAAAALEAERRLDPRRFGFWDFYVAMIHARQGRKGEARACFDRAESWMKVNGMQRKHERIRRESAALLGLDDSGGAGVAAAPPRPLQAKSN